NPGGGPACGIGSSGSGLKRRVRRGTPTTAKVTGVHLSGSGSAGTLARAFTIKHRPLLAVVILRQGLRVESEAEGRVSFKGGLNRLRLVSAPVLVTAGWRLNAGVSKPEVCIGVRLPHGVGKDIRAAGAELPGAIRKKGARQGAGDQRPEGARSELVN